MNILHARGRKSTYTKFVVDLHERLIQAHQDVKEKLKVAQHHQKDALDKGVRYTVYQPGDLVLHFSPQIKPGEPNKFFTVNGRVHMKSWNVFQK